MTSLGLEEIKTYLGLDGNEQDKLLLTLLDSANKIVEKVLRIDILNQDLPEIINTARLYIIWNMYFHRDNTELKSNELETTVATMLSDIRKKEF